MAIAGRRANKYPLRQIDTSPVNAIFLNVTYLNMLYNIFHLKIVCELTIDFITFIENFPARKQTQHVFSEQPVLFHRAGNNPFQSTEWENRFDGRIDSVRQIKNHWGPIGCDHVVWLLGIQLFRS